MTSAMTGRLGSIAEPLPLVAAPLGALVNGDMDSNKEPYHTVGDLVPTGRLASGHRWIEREWRARDIPFKASAGTLRAYCQPGN